VEDPVFVYVVGTAGSGKSRFTAAMQRWMKERGLDLVSLNLDPGAESLPYGPDVDIRDWIRLADVMEKYELGPNGAQIMAADLIALKLGEIDAVLEEYRAPYILVDTPGQTELFVFRESGRITMELLGPKRSVIVFLLDPFLARRPSAFVSMLMLSATTQFRFGVPVLNVITKRDLLKDEELARIQSWSESSDALEAALLDEKPDLYTQMSTDTFRVIDAMAGMSKAVSVSSETLEGLEDVYTFIQGVFDYGDDLKSD
jgi:GPN-loop GTPase